jgi:hypothetical protein
MATIKTQIVHTRPSTDVLFGDWQGSDLAAYITEFNDLPINFTCDWSADGLTRTRVEWYDDSIKPQIDAINTKYAAQLQTESDRRTKAGITVSVTDLSSSTTSSTPAA